MQKLRMPVLKSDSFRIGISHESYWSSTLFKKLKIDKKQKKLKTNVNERTNIMLTDILIYSKLINCHTVILKDYISKKDKLFEWSKERIKLKLHKP